MFCFLEVILTLRLYPLQSLIRIGKCLKITFLFFFKLPCNTSVTYEEQGKQNSVRRLKTKRCTRMETILYKTDLYETNNRNDSNHQKLGSTFPSISTCVLCDYCEWNDLELLVGMVSEQITDDPYDGTIVMCFTIRK